MSRSDNVYELPKNLPVPTDDGACDHLTGLRLPSVEVAEMIFIKRLTLIIANGSIVKVFYPVFPPDQNAPEVLRWLSGHPKP